jgi:hypothetical protein
MGFVRRTRRMGWLSRNHPIMPRIRLDTQELSRKRYLNSQGSLRDIVHLRLYTYLLLGRDPQLREAILDTGAPVSLFPIGTWEDIIEMGVKCDAGEIIPDHQTSQLDKLPLYSVAGCTYRARYAWLDVTAIDSADRVTRLAPSRVFAALFAARVKAKSDPEPRDDRDGIRQIIMGLGGGILDGRYLVFSPHPDENRRRAWLQDEQPVDPTISTSISSSRIPPFA